MPRGEKTKYTDKQQRKAEHIEEGYEKRGVPEDEAEGVKAAIAKGLPDATAMNDLAAYIQTLPAQ